MECLRVGTEASPGRCRRSLPGYAPGRIWCGAEGCARILRPHDLVSQAENTNCGKCSRRSNACVELQTSSIFLFVKDPQIPQIDTDLGLEFPFDR